MVYIQGEGRSQGTLFLVVLDDLVPADHMCRVVEAFVEQLDMGTLGFGRAQPADTGRPGYDPRSLLKLYLYGYMNQIRSSRRMEAECRRNVEVMWLLERLYPDYKSISEFRRMPREAVTAAGSELVRFAKSFGLIRGEWIAVDGSKFRAVASIDTARERFQLQRYLDSMEKMDDEQTAEFDHSKVQAAIVFLWIFACSSSPSPSPWASASSLAPPLCFQSAVSISLATSKNLDVNLLVRAGPGPALSSLPKSRSLLFCSPVPAC
jgi:transposase